MFISIRSVIYYPPFEYISWVTNNIIIFFTTHKVNFFTNRRDTLKEKHNPISINK